MAGADERARSQTGLEAQQRLLDAKRNFEDARDNLRGTRDAIDQLRRQGRETLGVSRETVQNLRREYMQQRRDLIGQYDDLNSQFTKTKQLIGGDVGALLSEIQGLQNDITGTLTDFRAFPGNVWQNLLNQGIGGAVSGLPNIPGLSNPNIRADFGDFVGPEFVEGLSYAPEDVRQRIGDYWSVYNQVLQKVGIPPPSRTLIELLQAPWLVDFLRTGFAIADHVQSIAVESVFASIAVGVLGLGTIFGAAGLVGRLGGGIINRIVGRRIGLERPLPGLPGVRQLFRGAGRRAFSAEKSLYDMDVAIQWELYKYCAYAYARQMERYSSRHTGLLANSITVVAEAYTPMQVSCDAFYFWIHNAETGFEDQAQQDSFGPLSRVRGLIPAVRDAIHNTRYVIAGRVSQGVYRGPNFREAPQLTRRLLNP